jgi:hypothetical protein
MDMITEMGLPSGPADVAIFATKRLFPEFQEIEHIQECAECEIEIYPRAERLLGTGVAVRTAFVIAAS